MGRTEEENGQEEEEQRERLVFCFFQFRATC